MDDSGGQGVAPAGIEGTLADRGVAGTGADPATAPIPAQNSDPVDSGQVSDNGSSLSARMARRADQLEQKGSEWFGVPGFDDLVEIELRALGWGAIRKVQENNSRVRDDATRELYNMADQLVQATLGFRDVSGGEPAPIQDDWVQLARRMPDAPEDLTPRKAVLFLVGDKRLPFLINEWGEWAKSVRKSVDEEVVRDFDRTA